VGAIGDLTELGIVPASALSAEVAGTGTDQCLPVLSSLSALLPHGLVRGSTVAVSARRGGATSMVLALLAGASQGGAWCAVVGMPALSWVAASDVGADLERLAMVPYPGPDGAAVMATMLDGFDVVVVASPAPLAAGVCSRLSARARHGKAVLIAASAWPGANVTVSVEASTWHGRRRLRAQELTVAVSGRGNVGRPRRGQLWLPDVRDDATPIATPSEVPRLRVVS
jgi:hypothetical protein